MPLLAREEVAADVDEDLNLFVALLLVVKVGHHIEGLALFG